MARMRQFTQWMKALTSKRLAIVGVSTLVVLWGGTTLAAFAYDRAESDHLFPGVKIAGVEVGGLSRGQAVDRLRTHAKRYLSRPISIHVGKRTFHIVPRKLGVTANVVGAVERAMRSGDSMTWMDRSYHRLFNWSVDQHVPVASWLPQHHLQAFVRHLVGRIDRKAKNAAIIMSADRMHVVKQHASKGAHVDPKVALRRVAEALLRERPSVSIPVKITPPKVHDGDLGKTIAIDLSTNELHLWNGFRIVKTDPVATAVSPYSTPVGRWRIVEKEHDPVWINPGSAWAASMPATIPPGPSNPLGLRALRTSAPGILIHGTPEDWTVGTYASHGCIRMHESDAIALYPMVPMGTPVVIYGAPPWGASTIAGAPPGY